MSLQSHLLNKLSPIGYASLAFGIGLYSIKNDLVASFSISNRTLLLLSITFVFYGAAILIFNYLKGDRYQSSANILLNDELKVLRSMLAHAPNNKYENEEYRKKIDALEKTIKNFTSSQYQISLEEKDKILTDLRAVILSEASSSILTEIEKKYSENIQTENKAKSVKEQLESTRLRLRFEISALGRRGNVNLIIGVLTTVAAVGILANTVLDLGVVITRESFINHLAPRITLSLFIEVFSFFFLKLYKAGLAEIKYFQNELTNIEMKFISLDISLRAKDERLLADVLMEFSKTERNFILNKGQSTVEIEKLKSDNQSTSNMLSSFSKMVEAIKK